MRREAVAVPAGVSADYLARLERGNLTGVSGSPLEAVARALPLDEAERSPVRPGPGGRRLTEQPAAAAAPQRIRPGVQQLLDAMAGAAALPGNGRGDTVAANRVGRAPFAPMFDGPARGNGAPCTFLDARSTHF